MNTPPLARFLRVLFTSLSMAVLAGCGGGGNSAGTPLLKANAALTVSTAAGTTSVNPNSDVVIVATAQDGYGHALAGATITFTIASNGSGAVLQGSTTSSTTGTTPSLTETTDGSGVARAVYIAGSAQGLDSVDATVTGSSGVAVTQSVTLAVGAQAAAGPQYAVALSAAQATVLPSASETITATVTSGGLPMANAPVVFSFGLASSASGGTGPSLSSGAGLQYATTDSHGQATIGYTAGPQVGVDTVIADLVAAEPISNSGSTTGGTAAGSSSATNSISGTQQVLASGSLGIAVTYSAASTWKVALSGTPSSGTCVGNAAQSLVTCSPLPTNNAVAVSGGTAQQTIGSAVSLAAKVTDGSGNPIPGALVTFKLGSALSSAYEPYCTPPAALLGGACSTTSGGTTTTTAASTYLVEAGLLSTSTSGSGIVTSVQATTGTDGMAYAKYVPGGSPGTDVVLVTAGVTSAQVQGQASMSANVQ
jgi:hypothetical protein